MPEKHPLYMVQRVKRQTPPLVPGAAAPAAAPAAVTSQPPVSGEYNISTSGALLEQVPQGPGNLLHH